MKSLQAVIQAAEKELQDFEREAEIQREVIKRLKEVGNICYPLAAEEVKVKVETVRAFEKPKKRKTGSLKRAIADLMRTYCNDAMSTQEIHTRLVATGLTPTPRYDDTAHKVRELARDGLIAKIGYGAYKYILNDKTIIHTTDEGRSD